MGCAKRDRIRRSSFRSITPAQVIRASFPPLLLVLSIPILLGTLLQACSGSGGTTGFVRNLESITIDPVDSSIAVGTKVQLHATGTYKNKTTKDLTGLVTWESADTTVVLVSNAAAIKGLAGGIGAGATTVKARLHGITGVSTFTVTKAALTSITVEPVNPLVSKGTTVQMAAQGNFSDGTVQNLTTQVTWSSANSSIAQVSNTVGTQGLVTGVSVGNTPVTASFSGIAGSTTVTVTAATLTSITITVPVDSIALGTTAQLTATCNFSDGTTEDCTSEVSWTSANSGIASVSNTSPTQGLVTGVGVGSTTISGSFGGIQGSATVTVTDATLTSITVTPPEPSIAKDTTVQLTATGNFSDGTTEDLTTEVSWGSGDNSIAQVSNVSGTQGLVTGLAAGTTPVTAFLNGIEGSATVTVTAATLTSITITPPDPSIANGTTVQLTATGNFSDGTTQDLTTQVSWASGDETIAQVSDVPDTQGLVNGLAVGTASITATLNGIQGTATVTVTDATLIAIVETPPDPSLAKGTTKQEFATCDFSDGTTEDCTNEVSWTSSNINAVVSNAAGSKGLITGVAVGSSVIVAALDGLKDSTTVTVTAATLTAIVITPPDPSLAKGTTKQLFATCDFSDGTTEDCTDEVSWTSSNINAVVSNAAGSKGLVTGVAVGSSVIVATLDGLKDSTTVTVTAATLKSIVITPPGPILAKGTFVRLTATGTFSDGTTEDLTRQASWTSNNGKIAQVGNGKFLGGLVIGLAVGSATITATLDGIQGSTTVTVTTAILTAIVIVPPNPSLAQGTTVQLKAIGIFSDLTTEDITRSASWTSSDTTVATVTSTAIRKGFVKAVGQGSAIITATQAGISGSTTVIVTPAVLKSIQITPPNPSLAKGTTEQLTATGIFTDGTTEDLTLSASWTSSDRDVAKVTSIGMHRGFVAALAVGSATITATQEGISGSTTVTVTPAALKSVTVTPVNPSLPAGVSLQLTATGTFTDGTTQDFTNTAYWVSPLPEVATVSATGLVKGVTAGLSTFIDAEVILDGAVVSGSTDVSVTDAVVESITITPANPSIAKGTSEQLTAIGNLSDGTTEDLTKFVDWSVSPSSLAAIDTNGLLTAEKVGLGLISAEFVQDGKIIQGTTGLKVTPAVVASITITPVNPSVPFLGIKFFTATANFSDGSTQIVTLQTSWISSNPAVGIIYSSEPPSTGLFQAFFIPGTTTITATFMGFQDTTVVTVP
jgi:trimeric autotransporter adhesin